LVLVDKPAGLTSHDVVSRLRRLAGTRRVGHAGTLDPAATGVLVCGVGRATRLLGHLALTDKTYAATIRLGARTTTDDSDGEIITESEVDITEEALGSALATLTGAFEQVPSSVSAIKVNGRRAYARVRAGEDVTLAPRPVKVSRFELTARRGNDLDVVVDCSTGTYIRALARDLGEALGCGGHLAALRRTRVGRFGIDQAVSLDRLNTEGRVDSALLLLPRAVEQTFPRRDLTADEAREVSFGRSIAPYGSRPAVGAFAPDGAVVALMEDREDRARPLVVFAPQ
jgi:tRNA pseudouridine55 synthase